MDIQNVNWLGIFISTILSFIIGGLWYSPILFGKKWAKEAGISDEQVQKSNKLKIFGLSFLFTLIAALNLGFFLADPSINAASGAFYGFLTGFGWVAMAYGVIGLFELKSWNLIFINSGYWIVTLTIMGSIIGAF